MTGLKDTETFFLRMGERFKLRFDLELESVWSIFSMGYVSTRKDEEPFTPEQAAWIAGYEEGWADA